MLKGTPSLAGAGGQGAGGQSMTSLATICAETSVRAASTLLHCKCTLVTPGTIQIHGLGTTRRGVVARRGRQREGTGGEVARRWLRGGLGAGVGCGSLVLLDGDGCRKVGVKGRGERAASGKLKPYIFL